MVSGELVPEGGPTATTADNKDATRAVALHLTDALTINVTRFYRNADTWEALRSTCIPAMPGTRDCPRR